MLGHPKALSSMLAVTYTLSFRVSAYLLLAHGARNKQSGSRTATLLEKLGGAGGVVITTVIILSMIAGTSRHHQLYNIMLVFISFIITISIHTCDHICYASRIQTEPKCDVVEEEVDEAVVEVVGMGTANE